MEILQYTPVVAEYIDAFERLKNNFSCFAKIAENQFYAGTVLKNSNSPNPWVLDSEKSAWKALDTILQRVEIFKAIPLGSYLQLVANLTLPENVSVLFMNKDLNTVEIQV